MKVILQILKNPKEDYNANSISKIIGISSMGALKILKSLEKEQVLISKQIGKGIFYTINFDNSYTKQFLIFILKREAEHPIPHIKRWVSEIRKIKNADFAVLYGSVLTKHEKANDIDVLFAVEQKNFNKLKEEIGNINNLNDKKIHPLFQSMDDIIENIKKEDKVILNAIKGVVVFGEEKLLEVMKMYK